MIDGHYYWVGPKDLRADTLQEALRIAVGMLPEKKLGSSVYIRRGKQLDSPIYGRVKVLYDREDQSFKYVYFSTECKYGHTITVDFMTDKCTKWYNNMRRKPKKEEREFSGNMEDLK